jgi:DNA-binding NarL/FixJ family response regulator
MLDAGASAYLTKTGSPDILVETIRRVHLGNIRIEGLKAQDDAFLSQVDPYPQ